jgi:predicted CoA-substrate-specific enzyme activase
MISAGVDIGAQNTKVAILADGRMLAHSVVTSGIDIQAALSRALDEALLKAGIGRQAIEAIGATGMGKGNVPYAASIPSNSTASARGAQLFLPSARTVIDIGAEQSQVLTVDGSGRVLEVVRNDKCAAGAGAFLEEMASILQISVEELGALSLKSGKQIAMNSNCVVFAESEVISFLRNGGEPADIAWAVNDAVAARTFSMICGIPLKKDILFIGGVAKNEGVVRGLSHKLETEIVVLPEPRVVGAAGAALLAAERLQRGDE